MISSGAGADSSTDDKSGALVVGGKQNQGANSSTLATTWLDASAQGLNFGGVTDLDFDSGETGWLGAGSGKDALDSGVGNRKNASSDADLAGTRNYTGSDELWDEDQGDIGRGTDADHNAQDA